jgi:hypothetical protein
LPSPFKSPTATLLGRPVTVNDLATTKVGPAVVSGDRNTIVSGDWPAAAIPKSERQTTLDHSRTDNGSFIRPIM